MSQKSQNSSETPSSSIQTGETGSFGPPTYKSEGVTLTVSKFGAFADPETQKLSVVKAFTWKNRNNVEVEVITFGATITRIITPDHEGKLDDIVMGFDNMAGYTHYENPNIGCTIGRVANRIGRGKFFLDDVEIQVDQNIDGKHHLHGGHVGWGRKNWQAHVDDTKVRMTLLSKDGDSGYPGDVIATATFYLTEDNRFFIEYQAISSKLTAINMTSHSYFNLAGHVSRLLGHLFCFWVKVWIRLFMDF